MKRILIVEDSLDVGRLLQTALLTLDPDLQAALVPSAEEALLEAGRLPVDLLVTDIRLPGMTGVELARKLRARSPGVKVFAISGLATSALQKHAEEMRPDALLRKPLDVTRFLELVAEHLHLGGEKSTQAEPVEEAAAQPPRLSADLMARLRQELGAVAVLTLDETGNVTAQAGALPDLSFAPGWTAPLMTALAAGEKVSRRLSQRLPENVFAFHGALYDLIASPAADFALVIILEAGRDGLRLALAVEEVLKARRELLAVMEKMGLPDAPRLAAAPVKPAPETEEPALHQLEALFDQPSARVEPEAANAFWETEMEPPRPESSADGLSFDQAKQLGLTPGAGDEPADGPSQG